MARSRRPSGWLASGWPAPVGPVRGRAVGSSGPTGRTAYPGTAIDAVSHALETWVTKKQNAVSRLFSQEAWRRLNGSYERVLDAPDDVAARGEMLIGAHWAGTAIENSMLGAAHALANPLTATYGIVHGQAVSVMLPHVIRFNGAEYDRWYVDLLECTAGYNGFPQPESGAAGPVHGVRKVPRSVVRPHLRERALVPVFLGQDQRRNEDVVVETGERALAHESDGEVEHLFEVHGKHPVIEQRGRTQCRIAA